MDYSFLFKMFASLPRQGPGSNACTRKAFSVLTALPARAEIADIGCGVGMQTVELARICPECRITALDIYQPYLDALRQSAEDAGVSERMTTVRASMHDLPFPDASFDAAGPGVDLRHRVCRRARGLEAPAPAGRIPLPHRVGLIHRHALG